jgi:hypothetical protein
MSDVRAAIVADLANAGLTGRDLSGLVDVLTVLVETLEETK